MSKKSDNALLQPIKEVVELPFALAEIVAETEKAMPHVAALAESALDVVYGVSSLSLLALPGEAREQIRQIVAQWQGQAAA
ncbi:MAG: hypothetical protein AB7U82_27885 [Blastocatellales bacterium]